MVQNSTLYYIFDNTDSEIAEQASTKAIEIEFKDVLTQMPLIEAPEHCIKNVLNAVKL